MCGVNKKLDDVGQTLTPDRRQEEGSGSVSNGSRAIVAFRSAKGRSFAERTTTKFQTDLCQEERETKAFAKSLSQGEWEKGRSQVTGKGRFRRFW